MSHAAHSVQKCNQVFVSKFTDSGFAHTLTKEQNKNKKPQNIRDTGSYGSGSPYLSPQSSRTHFRCHSQGRQTDLCWDPLPTPRLCFVTLGTSPESISTTVKWDDVCSSQDDVKWCNVKLWDGMRVINFFTWDCPRFKTRSPESQETAQSHSKWGVGYSRW